MPYFIMIALIAIDQGTKFLITSHFEIGTDHILLPFLSFRLLYNEGVAFSLLEGKTTFLIVFTSIALLALIGVQVYMREQTHSKLIDYGLSLIVAGGIGNLIDRIWLGMVVDYISVGDRFPIFNFADICVCTGAGLIILYCLAEFRKEYKMVRK
ncbi:MAG: signal peptidase II [Clostridiales Family XIII bacterium]|nr:signal peptidase II [Clostridiales Family XIII bacterium]